VSPPTSAFAVILNVIAIATEKCWGVTDRFRPMPMARLAVPFGQAGADLTVGAVSASCHDRLRLRRGLAAG
jgi:ABC-2 type transport system permease protein